VASLVGAESVGGEQAVIQARETLERSGWLSALADAEQLSATVGESLPDPA
jgi:hypothetical protein